MARVVEEKRGRFVGVGAFAEPLDTLGYKPANVLFFIDRPQPGEAVDGPPTAAAMKLAS